MTSARQRPTRQADTYRAVVEAVDMGDPCPKHRALGVNSECPDCDQPPAAASEPTSGHNQGETT